MKSSSEKLCSNCQYSSGCAFRGDMQEVTFFCEEHQNARIPREEAPKPAFYFSDKVHRLEEATPAQRNILGLCSDCDIYSNCQFNKPGSGVWHCEEYC